MKTHGPRLRRVREAHRLNAQLAPAELHVVRPVLPVDHAFRASSQRAGDVGQNDDGELESLGLVNRQQLHERTIVGRERRFLFLRGRAHLIGNDVSLVFDDFGARASRRIDHLHGHAQVAIMVDTYLSDHQWRSGGTDQSSCDVKLGHDVVSLPIVV